MKETNKLYRVVLRGMTHNMVGISRGNSFVIAKDTAEAYQKVREYLDSKDLGFRYERELDTITLLAEEGDYPECRTQLFL